MPAARSSALPLGQVLLLLLVAGLPSGAGASELPVPDGAEYRLDVTAGAVDWEASLTIAPAEAPPRELSLLVFGDTEIVGVEADGLAHWELGEKDAPDAARPVQLSFRRPLDGPTRITVRGAMRTELGSPWSAPRVQVDGVTSHAGRVLIRTSPDVRLRAESTVGVRPLSGSELDGLVADARAESVKGFSIWQDEFQLDCATLARAPHVVADTRTELTVGPAGADLAYLAHLECAQAPLFELYVSLPAEWEPLAATLDGQAVPWTLLPVEAGVHRLHLAPAAPLAAGTAADLVLTARRRFEQQPLPEAGEELALPDARLAQATVREAVLAVQSTPGVTVAPADLVGYVPAPGHGVHGRLVWHRGHAEAVGTLRVVPVVPVVTDEVHVTTAAVEAEEAEASREPAVAAECRLTSRYDEGGEAQHVAEYDLAVSEAAALVVRLPKRSQFVAALIDGRPADALLRDQDVVIALPPARRRQAGCTLRLEFTTRGDHLNETRTLALPAPELRAAGGTAAPHPVPLIRQNWTLHLPHDVTVTGCGTALRIAEVPAVSWLGRAWHALTGHAGGAAGDEAAVHVRVIPREAGEGSEQTLTITTQHATRTVRWLAGSAALLGLWFLRHACLRTRGVAAAVALLVPLLLMPFAADRWLVWCDGALIGAAAGALLWTAHQCSRRLRPARRWRVAVPLIALAAAPHGTATAEGTDAAPRLFANAAVTTRVSDAGLTSATEYEIRILGSASDVLRFVLPPDVAVREITGPDVASWDVADDDGQRQLLVRLRQAARGATRVACTWSQLAQFDEGDTTIEFQPPRLAGAERESGTLAVSAAPGLQVSADDLVGDAIASEPGAQLARRFRAWPESISLTVSRALPETTAELEHAARVERHRVSIASRVRVDFRKIPQTRFQMFLPEGYQLLDVRGAGIDGWAVEDGLLTADFAAPQAGAAGLTLSGVVPRDPEETTAELAVPLPLDVAAMRTTLAVSFDESVGPEAPQHEGWIPAPTAPRSPSADVPQFVLTTESPEPVPVTFALKTRAAEIAADALTTLTLTDDAVETRLALRWDCRGRAVGRLAFTTPAALAEGLRFEGADAAAISREEAAPGRVRWIVSLPEAWRGERTLAAVTSRAVAEGDSLEAPRIEFESVDEAADGPRFTPLAGTRQAVVLFDRSERRQLVGPAAVAIDSAEAPWTLAPPTSLDGALAAVRLQAGQPQPRWSVQADAASAVTSTVIESADLRFDLAKTGDWRLEARYRIRNHAGRIRVAEPQGGTLAAATVDGRPARVIRREHGGEPLLEIELPDAAPGASASLDAVWNGRFEPSAWPVTARWKARPMPLPAPLLSTAEPDAAALTTLATRWTVSLPEPYRAEPVGRCDEVGRAGSTLSCTRLGAEPQLTIAVRSWRMRETLAGLAWAAGVIGVTALAVVVRRRSSQPTVGIEEHGAAHSRAA